MGASRRNRMLGSIRARLTFANVMASAAVFIALGGASYAAVSLPKNSVGSKQLRAHSIRQGDLASRSVGTRQLRRRSVTAPKLANAGVTKRTLSAWIRGQLRRRATAGPTGPAGPAGPRGPGAVAVRYSATAGTTPDPRTIIDTGGLTIRGSCNVTGGTALNLTLRSSFAATLYQTIALDSGPTAPPVQETAQTANQQLPLAAGTTFDPDDPEATDGYVRVAVHGIYSSPNNTLDYHFVVIVNDPPGAAPGSCSVNGVVVPA